MVQRQLWILTDMRFNMSCLPLGLRAELVCQLDATNNVKQESRRKSALNRAVKNDSGLLALLAKGSKLKKECPWQEKRN